MIEFIKGAFLLLFTFLVTGLALVLSFLPALLLAGGVYYVGPSLGFVVPFWPVLLLTVGVQFLFGVARKAND